MRSSHSRLATTISVGLLIAAALEVTCLGYLFGRL